MPRRKRIRDRRDAREFVGKTNDARKRGGSGWKQRHSRRLADAHAKYDAAVVWCHDNGWSLSISNNGHHWIFRRGTTVAEWWPSSAKLVLNKQFRDGIHTHGWDQVAALLARWEGIA